MILRQKTLKSSLQFEGKALHSGSQVKMCLEPQEADFGLAFKRMDLPDSPIIPALVDYVVDSERSTVLQKDGIKVRTVEHVLSALVGMGVDNCLVILDNEEVPILDGSTLEIVQAIEAVGLVELDKEKKIIEIREMISYEDQEHGISLYIEPGDDYEITAQLDFNSSFFAPQYAKFRNINNYSTEIAPARTFCFLREVCALLDKNLIQGGDLTNALVIMDEPISDEQLDKLHKHLGLQQRLPMNMGILGHNLARFSNEPARHKVLDIIGDLALVGYAFKGKIHAEKPGHRANVELAKKIRNWIQKNQQCLVPIYDPNKEPILDAREIMCRLPHRYPFLLVDKVLEMNDKHIIGVKNITFNEGFFAGHFPENPVMPGVLQIEAMAQTGGILALSLYDDPYNYDTYFLKIENAKFKRKIVPGDTMLLSLYLLEEIRRGICRMNAKIFVGSQVCTEAILVAQIVKARNLTEPPLLWFSKK